MYMQCFEGRYIHKYAPAFQGVLTHHVIAVFGLPSYRGKQDEIIEAAVKGIRYYVVREQLFT
jgi:hypothetical protein